MAEKDLLEALIDYKAIQVDQIASSWEQAIQILFQPLVDCEVCQSQYVADVIATTNKYGPYYLIAPNLAMPHATSYAVAHDGFTLATFKEPVVFSKEVQAQLLLGFCTKDPKSHITVAIPQIVKVFENVNNISAIISAPDAAKIIDIIKSQLNK